MLDEPSVEIDWTSAPEDATHCMPATAPVAPGVRLRPQPTWYQINSGVVERWDRDHWKNSGVSPMFVRKNPAMFVKRPEEVQS